jgi:hypothetical protein
VGATLFLTPVPLMLRQPRRQRPALRALSARRRRAHTAAANIRSKWPLSRPRVSLRRCDRTEPERGGPASRDCSRVSRSTRVDHRNDLRAVTGQRHRGAFGVWHSHLLYPVSNRGSPAFLVVDIALTAGPLFVADVMAGYVGTVIASFGAIVGILLLLMTGQHPSPFVLWLVAVVVGELAVLVCLLVTRPTTRR